MRVEEKHIIIGCKKGVRSAQHHLYTIYRPILLTVCIRYFRDQSIATDILHDIFIKIFSKIDQYNEKGSFEGWLKRLTANHCLTILKKKSPIQLTPLAEDLDIEQEITIENHFSKEQLFHSLNTIPLEFSIVFSMFYLDDFSHKEIAKELNINEQTCRTRLYRAKKLLQLELKKIRHED